MSPTSYRAAPPRGDGRNVPDTVGGVNPAAVDPRLAVYSPAMQVQLRKVGQVALNVPALDRARPFYTDLLRLGGRGRYPPPMRPGRLGSLRATTHPHRVAR